MDIRDLIRQRARALAKTHDRIRDARVFDFNYIPDQPLMRCEAEPVIDACLRYLATGIPNHLFLFGSRGCGKTLLVRYLGRLLSQDHGAHVLYVNCRHHNTTFKILAHLLHVRPRGHGLAELWQRFGDTQPTPLVLVLDEVDLLSDKDRNRELLYFLSRSPRNDMAILLSNHPKFLQSLDESIRSTLQPELVHFRNYDAPQIEAILRHRVEHGLAPSADPPLAQIAALTARHTHSDVRVAIKTLYYVAMEPDQEVQVLFDRARRDLITDILHALHPRNVLILEAVVRTRPPFVKAIYDRYCDLSREQHEEPCSYVHFYTNLAYLQSIGLLMLVSTKVGRAYTNRVELLFDPQVLKAVNQA